MATVNTRERLSPILDLVRAASQERGWENDGGLVQNAGFSFGKWCGERMMPYDDLISRNDVFRSYLVLRRELFGAKAMHVPCEMESKGATSRY